MQGVLNAIEPLRDLSSRFGKELPSDLLIEASLIGPDWISDYGIGHLTVADPASGAVIGIVPKAPETDVERTLWTASLAFDRWRRVPARTRASALRRWYDLIIERRDALIVLLTAEQGKPFAEAVAEIEYAASFVRWYSEEAEWVYGRIAPSLDGVSRLTVHKVPVGVVAAAHAQATAS